jgi:hypothetical protein
MTRYNKNKGGFAYEVVIDHEEKSVTVEEYLNGKRRVTPYYKSYDDNINHVARACRAVAYALLERADGIQHSKDFCREPDIEEQIKLMMEEKTYIDFEGD